MKSVTKLAAQGDVLFRKVEKLPDGFETASKNEATVAHSETGHNHVAYGSFEHFVNPKDQMISYIVARGPVKVEHHRSFDTHETLELKGEVGETIWEIRRQREHTPEGWRRLED